MAPDTFDFTPTINSKMGSIVSRFSTGVDETEQALQCRSNICRCRKCNSRGMIVCFVPVAIAYALGHISRFVRIRLLDVRIMGQFGERSWPRCYCGYYRGAGSVVVFELTIYRTAFHGPNYVVFGER
jgi:hypothetical protein